ncbi:MAG TPA: hypothetical protein VK102_11770 [Sphingobacterium sp.]|nr:hypothetical protein [Sphingobacterium sp.]
MNLNDHPELQAAIIAMEPKKKDNLLLRLIRKDKLLVEQLHFRLLEDEKDLLDRVEKLKNQIDDSLYDLKDTIQTTFSHNGFKELNSTVRSLHGRIGHHEKVTRDALSDVDCRVYVLKALFENYPEFFQYTLIKSGAKFQKYILGRIAHLFKKYDKLHEDYQFDFAEDITFIQDFISKNRHLE